jgi:diadenosine tetraphosphatase ApaH/serine/threonine PP2A family protein phosphatase
MKRTIVIGDIHGCYDELIALLHKVDLRADDRLVAVGDLTVKGPKSREVLDLFTEDVRFSSVIGNHDLALVKHWRGEGSTLKPSQEAAWKELEQGGEHYFQYLSALPFKADLGSHIVVHAGLRPGVPLEEQSQEDLTELRTLGPDRTLRQGLPWYEVYSDSKIALFGHWPALEPRRGRSAIGLDTGCVYGNRLTSYIIETGEFISVAAEKAYSTREPNDTSDAS